MPKELTREEFAAEGVTFSARQMDNGENRYSVMVGGSHGYGATITKIPEGKCGWQSSHLHKSARETYIVQQGTIALAKFSDESGDLEIKVFRAGDIFTIRPGIAHNIYLYAGAVFHTVRHGELTGEKDWFASELLDLRTKHLTETQIEVLSQDWLP